MLSQDPVKFRHPYASVGACIKAYRLKAKLTQLQLAERVGTCQASIAHYEADRVNPPLHRIQKLCRELSIPVELLIGCKTSFLAD